MTNYELKKGEGGWFQLVRDGKVIGVAKTVEQLATLLEAHHLKLTPT